jgi:hypothetical protein
MTNRRSTYGEYLPHDLKAARNGPPAPPPGHLTAAAAGGLQPRGTPVDWPEVVHIVDAPTQRAAEDAARARDVHAETIGAVEDL